MSDWFQKVKLYITDNPVIKRAGIALSMSFLGATASRICLLLLNILLSRILGQEDFGRYSLVNNTIQTFVTFASLGLGASLLRYTSLYRDSSKAKCGQMIGTFSLICAGASTLIAVLLFSLSTPLSLWVDSSFELSSLFKIASVVVLFIALYSIFQNILLGFEAYKAVTVNEIAYGVICLLITILFAKVLGIVGAIVGMLCARLIGSILMGRSAFVQCKKNAIPCSVHFDDTIGSSFGSFVLPSFLSSIIVLPVNWCLNIILAKNAGYAELSVYTVSYQWVAMIAYVMSLFTRIKPIYTDLYAKGEFVEFKKLLKKMVLLSSLVGVPVAMVGVLGSRWIMSFYGADYSAYWLVFSVMMLASVAMTLQSQFGAVFEAIGKMWIGFLLNTVWAMNLLVVFYFLKSHGALGCSIAFLVSYFLHCVYCWGITVILVRKKLQRNTQLLI